MNSQERPPLHIAITYQPKSTDQKLQPSLREAMNQAVAASLYSSSADPLINGESEQYYRDRLNKMSRAAEIRAVAQYLQDNGLVSTTGTKSTPGSDARLLEALEQEAQRAEAGE